MATTALSHLLFFDALSSILCTAVLVGRNFEVWTRSSLRNPFGLERTELVAGLAMSIVLLFMGLDLISHGLTHSLENVGGHEAHHAHVHHEHAHDGELNIPALAAILSTLISATSSGSESRVGRSIQHSSALPSWVLTILRNPPHVLILTCATLLLALPLLQPTLHTPLDSALAFTLALAMIFFGARLCYTLGRVLLMSYPSANGNEVGEVVAEIWDVEGVLEVSEAKCWMVHYGLCMAGFRVGVRERADVERVRRRIEQIVRETLGKVGEGSDGKGKRARWEVSSMISVVGAD
jgi:divalent metal cation (Fe/Co/Zn/Cd) transporter